MGDAVSTDGLCGCLGGWTTVLAWVDDEAEWPLLFWLAWLKNFAKSERSSGEMVIDGLGKMYLKHLILRTRSGESES